MTGNTTPHRMTWFEQKDSDESLRVKSERTAHRKTVLKNFLEDLIGVAAIAVIFVGFCLFTI